MVKNVKTRSKQLQRKFLIRRIVALVVLLALIVAIGWGIRAVMSRRGASSSDGNSSQSTSQSSQTAQNSEQSKTGDANAKGTFRSDKAKASGIPDCSSDDVTVTLSADNATIAADGSLNFTKTFAHKGSTDCLVDTSDDSMAVVITNTDGVQVWRSDACAVDPSQILLGQDDTYQKNMTWNGSISNTTVDGSIAERSTVNAAGQACMNAGETAPHVVAGDYTAELINVADDSMKSEAVKFSVSQ
ncbi:hypothetical protein EJ419_03035 [Alloscardovia theropitheci]|uniref:Peptide ABC transporter permease n=1 Tax=Alloscardovia theropitheci TaxID=2496842 RepID=A0A4R0QQA0_9BIFI|nr:hypothetical protein [Alloscardovia theropitheci]TCD54464.1 hypothetical protein EJ419_03035 [Alloscardovia theropitheci]